MKIIGFAGSNSSQSINKQLVKYTLSKIEQVEVEWVDITDYPLPIFGVDLEEAEGIPENAKQFVEKLQSADGIVLSLAEHNQSYTVAAKNLFDWCSRHSLKFFNDIPVFLMGTSPGGYGAKNVIHAAESRLPKFGANIISVFSLPSFYDNFNSENGIIHQDLRQEHQELLNQFINKTLK
ncbi:NADPH-dependent FMN reductase [Brumimicrobium aurantiacum]|uniref:NADPH-dependent oxidoreductase n=1 Tax=Brumimicrobium aurantiacum TaxID=1737063 RepID=A0A3E1EZI3_9FLAO|nr:NAD(P)H-dependent oxidoreductase [Brumimicrobium aurantiacum]RFC54964.1 NADPH-dependent oxidoreductase [Brumimicrobium aurantiacum]